MLRRGCRWRWWCSCRRMVARDDWEWMSCSKPLLMRGIGIAACSVMRRISVLLGLGIEGLFPRGGTQPSARPKAMPPQEWNPT